jgi:predicted SnoaL-like aldol condensation-catalyzing enzyme
MTRQEISNIFLQLCAKGQARQAFGDFCDPEFRHHNAYFKSDANTLMEAMEADAAQHPDRIFHIHRALEDGDLVAVHSHIRNNANEAGYAAIHILRFEGEKIVELWDIVQEVPRDMVNETGMF